VVKHVYDLRRNLISISQLESEGCTITFIDNSWKATKASLLIAKGEKVCTFFLCTGNADSSISLLYAWVDTTLLHHRLGQMSEKGMQILHSRHFFSRFEVG
jgi:hypothetical protein